MFIAEGSRQRCQSILEYSTLSNKFYLNQSIVALFELDILVSNKDPPLAVISGVLVSGTIL
jgi:hypothetical protein